MTNKTEIPGIIMTLSDMDYALVNSALSDKQLAEHNGFYRPDGDQLVTRDTGVEVDIFYVEINKEVSVMKVKHPYLGKASVVHFNGKERAIELAKSKLREIIQKSKPTESNQELVQV